MGEYARGVFCQLAIHALMARLGSSGDMLESDHEAMALEINTVLRIVKNNLTEVRNNHARRHIRRILVINAEVRRLKGRGAHRKRRFLLWDSLAEVAILAGVLVTGVQLDECRQRTM
jgi:hypothetical protein